MTVKKPMSAGLSRRLTETEQRRCWAWEARHYASLSADKQRRYQQWLAARGGRLRPEHAVSLAAVSSTPYWLLEPAGRFQRFRSTAQLPSRADVVIIGAGLTGTSAFYHLQDAGLHVVLLEEAERPCAQSSGKNGGNLELMAESYIGAYDGIMGERADILRSHFPHLHATEVQAHAERDTQLILDFTVRNLERFVTLVAREKIDCDYSAGGWLQLASDATEAKAMTGDKRWLSDEMELVTPAAMVRRWGLVRPPKFHGRFIPRSGNFRPPAFVHAVLTRALDASPQLQLFTQVKVQGINSRAGGVQVSTSDGVIHAGTVIVATNAFTPHVLPELQSIIRCQPSQIVNLEHVRHDLHGATVTEQAGEIYYNSPARTVYQRRGETFGMLHYGTDQPEYVDDAYHVRRSVTLFRRMLTDIHERFPETQQQPPTRCWAGPLGMTSDRIPLIGWLRPHVLIAAGFNGFGGSWCIESGAVVAGLAASGGNMSAEEQLVFSPRRFFHPAHHWRPSAATIPEKKSARNVVPHHP